MLNGMYEGDSDLGLFDLFSNKTSSTSTISNKISALVDDAAKNYTDGAGLVLANNPTAHKASVEQILRTKMQRAGGNQEQFKDSLVQNCFYFENQRMHWTAMMQQMLSQTSNPAPGNVLRAIDNVNNAARNDTSRWATPNPELYNPLSTKSLPAQIEWLKYRYGQLSIGSDMIINVTEKLIQSKEGLNILADKSISNDKKISMLLQNIDRIVSKTMW